MSISLDSNNLIINTTSNAISIICSSDYTRVSDLNVPNGFLAPTTLITPSIDAIIGMSGKVTGGSGTIDDATIEDLNATYTFTSPGVYLINLYVSITPSITTTIINCGLGLSTSSTSFVDGTGQINCYNIAVFQNNTTKFTATIQKVITVGANLQHYFLINIDITSGTFAYATSDCYWTYIKIG
jgi:hypothetical protein